MGSLMSGWNSPLQDPNKAKLMRNKSLTRGEIDAYWKSKKKTEEDHFRSISASVPTTPTARRCRDTDYEDHHQVVFYRSISMPVERSTASSSSTSELHVAVDRLAAKYGEGQPLVFKETSTTISSCWWTVSNSAFLNEPPVLTSEAAERQRPYNLVH